MVAILAPLLAPYPGDVSASHLLRRLKPPSWAHPFGTDNLGRDIFSRVILGARGALTIALMVVGISMLIGVPLGLVAGYYQGWASEAIMRVTDVFLAVPQLILALAIAQLMGPILAERHAGADPHLLAVLHPHRLCRGAAAEGRRSSSTRCNASVRAARASCFCTSCPTASRPSSCAPPSAWASRSWSRRCWASSAWAPLRPIPTGASPSPRAAHYLPDAWWFSTFPGLAIFLTVLGFNLLGDGLRDIVDPRLRRSR